MSNFICEHCGADIIEGEGGHYITGCEHYPLDKTPEDRASRVMQDFFVRCDMHYNGLNIGQAKTNILEDLIVQAITEAVAECEEALHTELRIRDGKISELQSHIDHVEAEKRVLHAMVAEKYEEIDELLQQGMSDAFDSLYLEEDIKSANERIKSLESKLEKAVGALKLLVEGITARMGDAEYSFLIVEQVDIAKQALKEITKTER